MPSLPLLNLPFWGKSSANSVERQFIDRGVGMCKHHSEWQDKCSCTVWVAVRYLCQQAWCGPWCRDSSDWGRNNDNKLLHRKDLFGGGFDCAYRSCCIHCPVDSWSMSHTCYQWEYTLVAASLHPLYNIYLGAHTLCQIVPKVYWPQTDQGHECWIATCYHGLKFTIIQMWVGQIHTNHAHFSLTTLHYWISHNKRPSQ